MVMQDFLQILVVVAMAVTAIILVAGIFSLVRRGPDSGNLSNRLMRCRVIFQAIAIALFVLVMWLARR